MNQEKEKCLAMGMNEFISKPFDQKFLVDTINRLCHTAAA
jgi:CheY-like chemotaxis protein